MWTGKAFAKQKLDLLWASPLSQTYKLLQWFFIFSINPCFSLLSHTTARVEGPQAKQPSSVSCGVRLVWIMAEDGRRCNSSRSADKLSLLDASIPTFPQSHQHRGSGTAHRASSQQSFNNSLPPGKQPMQAFMVSGCLLKAFSFHILPLLLLFCFSSFFFQWCTVAWCFFHFSNLNSLLLYSLCSQRKPRGPCSYSLLLLCFIFFLMTQNYPPRASSFQPRSWRKRMVNPILFCLFKGSPTKL